MEPEAIEGVLHFYFETGTEGGDWAFQDKRHIFQADPLPPGTPDGPSGVLTPVVGEDGHVTTRPLLRSELPRERYAYEGLHILADGDHLTIYDEKGLMVVWMGVIKLIQHPLFTEHTSTGLWIHADQDGVPRDVWETFFLEGRQAKLVPARR